MFLNCSVKIVLFPEVFIHINTYTPDFKAKTQLIEKNQILLLMED